jgi:hypothetical protein
VNFWLRAEPHSRWYADALLPIHAVPFTKEHTGAWMKFLSSQRFLVVYSGVLTIVFYITVLCGFTSATATEDGDRV